ncbi:MAG: hypothetical protein HQL19_07240 [Candidatus Omnitrophica bacterium]|nr:hypothetical protein [Candidatus Omnitrophota bacterium]
MKSFADIYRRSKQARPVDRTQSLAGLVQLRPQMGYMKPYLPVFNDPRVIKVWIPPHVIPGDRNVLVGGHWTFVMLETPGWFIENEVTGKVSVPVLVPTAPEGGK